MKAVCVFAGSSAGIQPQYTHVARELGWELGARGLDLVYGGARVGLMGTLADAALSRGTRVTGVIPAALVAKEVAHGGLSDLRVVASMHERKAVMADISDAFIALPGGWGTLEELFEVLTWGQLGLHQKPCGLLNAQGYYDRLLSFLEYSVEQGFVRHQYRSMIAVADSPGALLDRIAAYQPPLVEKWIDRAST